MFHSFSFVFQKLNNQSCFLVSSVPLHLQPAWLFSLHTVLRQRPVDSGSGVSLARQRKIWNPRNRTGIRQAHESSPSIPFSLGSLGSFLSKFSSALWLMALLHERGTAVSATGLTLNPFSVASPTKQPTNQPTIQPTLDGSRNAVEQSVPCWFYTRSSIWWSLLAGWGDVPFKDDEGKGLIRRAILSGKLFPFFCTRWCDLVFFVCTILTRNILADSPTRRTYSRISVR